MPRKPKYGDGLTLRQELFCEEYIKDFHITNAALRAGYSEKSAHVEGFKLLKKPKIALRVEEAKQQRMQRVQVKADDILREILKIATCDIAQAFDESGALKPIHEIPEEVRRAMSSVEILEQHEGTGKNRVYVGDVKKIRFWDKVKALELLGKHMKLFTEKHEHSGPDGKPIEIVASRMDSEEIDSRIQLLLEKQNALPVQSVKLHDYFDPEKSNEDK